MSFDEKAARKFTGKFKPGDRVLMAYGSEWIPGTIVQKDPLEYDRSVMGYMVRLAEPGKKKDKDPYWGENAEPKSGNVLWSTENELKFDVLSQLAQI